MWGCSQFTVSMAMLAWEATAMFAASTCEGWLLPHSPPHPAHCSVPPWAFYRCHDPSCVLPLPAEKPSPQQTKQGKCDHASAAWSPAAHLLRFIHRLQVSWSDFTPVGACSQSMNRTKASAKGPNPTIRCRPLRCSHEDGWASMCRAGEGSFLTVVKCSFLQGKAQHLALVACHNPTLCFWSCER